MTDSDPTARVPPADNDARTDEHRSRASHGCPRVREVTSGDTSGGCKTGTSGTRTRRIRWRREGSP